MSENGEETCGKSKNDQGSGDNNDEQENDPHYDPIISLPEIEIPTLEEEEIEMVNLRAKIYRYDSQENPPEWKERGTGNIKMLHHKSKGTVRVVMRRDKTLKLCANHFISPQMELKPSASCEVAWVYSVKADYIDETVKSHLLAVKFANIENAQKWKDAWDEARKIAVKGGTPNNDVLEEEKKVITDDALKLNDTFDEEKKNNSVAKEENDKKENEKENEKEKEKKNKNENEDENEETKENEKGSHSEVAEKLICLNIKDSGNEKSS